MEKYVEKPKGRDLDCKFCLNKGPSSDRDWWRTVFYSNALGTFNFGGGSMTSQSKAFDNHGETFRYDVPISVAFCCFTGFNKGPHGKFDLKFNSTRLHSLVLFRIVTMVSRTKFSISLSNSPKKWDAFHSPILGSTWSNHLNLFNLTFSIWPKVNILEQKYVQQNNKPQAPTQIAGGKWIIS